MELIELTILIPCLNEEKTLGICIQKAKKFLKANNITGEVLVVNNCSTDNSEIIAKNLDARVELVTRKGYGATLINGNRMAKGKYVIMGDADDSYNFLEANNIYLKLKEGNDLVIGNRYKGKMEKGSMRFFHKYIGTPFISWLARFKFKVNIGDFNCGMRGYNKEKINNLNCTCLGMEYASEMIIEAQKNNLKIAEVPINFYKDGRKGGSHLNPIRDGIRHLMLILSR